MARQALVEDQIAVDLDPAVLHLRDVGEIAAQGARSGVDDVGLVVADRGVEIVDVQPQPVAPQLRLDPDLPGLVFFRLDHGGVEGGLVLGVERQARHVDPAGFAGMGPAGVGHHPVGDVVGADDAARQVAVVDRGGVGLGPQDRQLGVGLGLVGRRPAAVDRRVVGPVLGLVGVAGAAGNVELRGQAPGQFTEGGVAVALEAGAAVGGVTVEEAGRIALSGQQPVAGHRAVLGDRLAVDHLAEEVEAADVFQRLAAVGGDAQFLAVLVLTRGNVLQQLDRQAGVVAVVGRVPVPPAPGRH